MIPHFKVVCLDDTNRPDGIPSSKWIKKGDTYTVIEVAKMRVQGGLLGFKLEEVNIDSCFPYQFFAAKRFGIPIQGQDWAEQELSRLLKEAQQEAAKPEVLV
jgi:hypothetical protein